MKKTISVLLAVALLVVCLVVPISAANHPFTDVPEKAWYAGNVQFVYEKGLMAGTAADKFSPETKMNRAMLVTVLYRMDGSHAASGTTPFTDVQTKEYYYPALVWAYGNGIIKGTAPDKFSPKAPITREMMVAIFYRYAQFKGLDVSKTASLSKYTDAGKISNYAKTPFAWAVAAGVIFGNSATTLNPLGTATRAECAAILQRFYGLTQSSSDPTEPNPTETVTEHTHEYGIWQTVDPTCTEDGYYIRYCICGASETKVGDPHSGHDWGEWVTVKEPSDSSDGIAERICSVCGEKETKILAYCTHDYQIIVGGATCTTGVSETYVCRLCGYSYTEVLGENDPDAHYYVVTDFVAASGICAEDGHGTYRCIYCGNTYTQTITGHSWEYHYESPGHYGERYLQCELCEWYVLESDVEAGHLSLAMQEHMIDVHGSADVRKNPYGDMTEFFYGKSWTVLHQWISEDEDKEYWKCSECGKITDTAPCEHQWDYYNNYESVKENHYSIVPLNGSVECSCGWYPTYKNSTNDGMLTYDWGDHGMTTPYGFLHSWHSPTANDFDLYTILQTATAKCVKCGESISMSMDIHNWHPIDSSVYSVWSAECEETGKSGICIREFGEAHAWVLDEHIESQYTTTSGTHTVWKDIWKCEDCGVTTSFFQDSSDNTFYTYKYVTPSEYELWECAGCGAITFEKPLEYKDKFYRDNIH